MAERSTRNWDITIDGVGYMLAGRDQLDRGELAWERLKPSKPWFGPQPPWLVQGERPDEFYFDFVNTGAGWGAFRDGVGDYGYAENTDGRTPGQVTLAPKLNSVNGAVANSVAVNPVALFEIPGNTKLWFASGNRLQSFTPSGTPSLSSVANISPSAYNEVAVGAGVALLAAFDPSSDVADQLRQITAGEVITQSGGSLAIDAVCVGADSTGATFIGSLRSGGISQWKKVPQDAALLTSGNWSSNGVPVGETGEIVRWLFQYGFSTIAGCPSGYYEFDEYLNSVPISPEMAMWRDTAYNFRQSRVWDGDAYLLHSQGLYRYDGEVLEDVTPTRNTGIRQDNNSRRFGFPVAVWPGPRELYCSMWNGTDTYVFAGTKRNGRLVWDPIVYTGGLTNKGPFTVGAITGKTAPPRTFMGQLATTDAIAYWDISRDGNPLQDPQPFAASGSLYSRFYHLGVPIVFEEMTVDSSHPSSSETITLDYRTTETGAFSTVPESGATTISASGITTIRSTSFGTGAGLQWRVNLARGATTTNTPVLRRVRARVLARPPRGQLIRALVVIKEGQVDRRGKPRTESARTLITALKAMESGTATKVVKDPFDSSATCLLDGAVHLRGIRLDGNGMPFGVAEVVFREVGQ